MSNKLCPYCGSEVKVVEGTKIGSCPHEGCPIADVPIRLTAWNRRHVCPDKNGDPVFSDSHINIELGDGSEHECFLQYQQHQWWATDIDATFGVRMDFKLSECVEIELIEESESEE